MSVLAPERPVVRHGEPVPSLFDDVRGGPTLDEVLSGAWEGLAAHQRVPCPMCGGEMGPEYGAHARPIGGRCGSCGTHLG